MKEVMVRAWEIVKEAVKNFGGCAKAYLSGALKMAWAEVKAQAGRRMSDADAQRAQSLKLSLNITSKLAIKLVEVEKAFQGYNGMSADNHLKFNVWRGRRVYITCPWWSKYQNSKGNYVDMETLELHARYVRL